MKKGNSVITVPILLVFSIIVISTIGVLLINVLKPYIMYEKLLSISLKYMFILEEYGYMTQNDKQMLIDELIQEGFDEENIFIDATNKMQSYGDIVYLSITYYYTMEIPVIIGNTLLVDSQEKNTPMKIIKYGISKR